MSTNALQPIQAQPRRERKLTAKQEAFAQCLFQGMSQIQAYRACYNVRPDYPVSLLYPMASRVANSAKIVARVNQLFDRAAERGAIATVAERQKILSEISRGRPGHFVDEAGNLLPDADLNNAAIKEIRKTVDRDGNEHITIKLHRPQDGIDLLNKMDRLYIDEPVTGAQNNQFNIIVGNDVTKALLARLGKRDLTPEEAAALVAGEAGGAHNKGYVNNPEAIQPIAPGPSAAMLPDVDHSAGQPEPDDAGQ